MAGSPRSLAITGAKKRPFRNTVKEKRIFAVFCVILRFRMHIQDFFAAVDKWPGILCSPIFSEGKRGLIWAYFGYGRDTKGSACLSNRENELLHSPLPSRIRESGRPLPLSKERSIKISLYSAQAHLYLFRCQPKSCIRVTC